MFVSLDGGILPGHRAMAGILIFASQQLPNPTSSPENRDAHITQAFLVGGHFICCEVAVHIPSFHERTYHSGYHQSGISHQNRQVHNGEVCRL